VFGVGHGPVDAVVVSVGGVPGEGFAAVVSAAERIQVSPSGAGWWWSRSHRSAGTVQVGNRQLPARMLMAAASRVEGRRPSSVTSRSRPPLSVSSRVNRISSRLSG
jgi:hypothetical protein